MQYLQRPLHQICQSHQNQGLIRWYRYPSATNAKRTPSYILMLFSLGQGYILIHFWSFQSLF